MVTDYGAYGTAVNYGVLVRCRRNLTGITYGRVRAIRMREGVVLWKVFLLFCRYYS